MKLSTRIRYGARAMLDLAHYYGSNPVYLKDVARRQEISLKYLDRIFSSLKARGLVRTIRGPKGGYTLNSPPEKITLGQIMEALDGPVELVACVHHEDNCHRSESCLMRQVWQDLGENMKKMLNSTSLQDLLTRGSRDKHSKMYYI